MWDHADVEGYYARGCCVTHLHGRTRTRRSQCTGYHGHGQLSPSTHAALLMWVPLMWYHRSAACDGTHAILMTGARCVGRAQTKARWHRDFGSAFAQGMHWEPVAPRPACLLICMHVAVIWGHGGGPADGGLDDVCDADAHCRVGLCASGSTRAQRRSHGLIPHPEHQITSTRHASLVQDAGASCSPWPPSFGVGGVRAC